jgi:hypothetical protein
MMSEQAQKVRQAEQFAAVDLVESLIVAHAGGLSPQLRALIEDNPEATRKAVVRHFCAAPQSARLRRATLAAAGVSCGY